MGTLGSLVSRARHWFLGFGPRAPRAEPPPVRERPTYELVALARQAISGDAAYWTAVTELQDRGTRAVLDAALTLSSSDDPRDRELGVDILAQGRAARKTFHDEAVAALVHLLHREGAPSVLASISHALGHRRDPRTIGPLAHHKDHPATAVRLGVVAGLLTYDEHVAVAALIDLSADEDRDVRDWATFGLGTLIDRDTSDVRDALALRLADEDDDTRYEAIVGLARRRDGRALEPLLEALAEDDVMTLAIEGAESLGDPRLCPALLRLAAIGHDGLAEALRACGCEPPAPEGELDA